MVALAAWRLYGAVQPGRRFRLKARHLSSIALQIGLPELFAAVEQPGSDGGSAGGSPRAGGLHIVQSTSCNVFANLAVEQRLLERAHHDSRVLFLYRNAPCVVIGRNQNPWTEVSLGRLRAGDQQQQQRGRRLALGDDTRGSFLDDGPCLVRRRSGGGTVYHDGGNANWSVVQPSAGFDRDQHAWMVARALQQLGVAGARVNERHDIVVDGAAHAEEGGKDYGSNGEDDHLAAVSPKVSGSAYKLTRRRALHHGTCLLTADLAAVSGLLRSPAAPYVHARGVASVRSPVANVGLGQHGNGANATLDDHASLCWTRFAAAVAAEFEAMYGPATSCSLVDVDQYTEAAAVEPFAFDPVLSKGYAELQTPEWIYGQTPQFSFSTHPTEADPRPRPPPPPDVPADFHLAFTSRHGQLQDIQIANLACPSSSNSSSSGSSRGKEIDRSVAAALDGQLLYRISNWRATLASASTTAGRDAAGIAAIGAWLDLLLGVP